MAALCVPSEWLQTTVGLRAAYCHICVGNVTTSGNVDGAAEACVIWRRGDGELEMTPEVRTGGRRGCVDGRASTSEMRAIARGTGARVLGAYDNVARIRRKSSGPNNTTQHNTTQHTHTHTHTHISGKVSGDGSMAQLSKFGLTLEIWFDTVVSRHVLQLYHKRQVVPRHLGCRTSLCTSFGTGVRRARRAFGVRLSGGVRAHGRVCGGGG